MLFFLVKGNVFFTFVMKLYQFFLSLEWNNYMGMVEVIQKETLSPIHNNISLKNDALSANHNFL